MRRESRICITIPAILLVLAAAGPAHAQQNRVGRVEKIASLGAGARPVRITRATDLVEIARGGPAWIAVGPNEVLYDLDRLRVRRYADMRLVVERPAHQGRLTFLAEVLDDDGGRVFNVSNVPERANYRFIADTMNTGELGVVIDSGALVVRWDAGRLRVTAAGHPALITETRVVFVTDAAGTSGFLYVEEGTVEFPATPGLVAGAGQVVRLQAGTPPAIAPAEPAQLARYRAASRYNADRIWSRLTPFWRKPAFLLPAVGVVAGATAYFVTRSDSGAGPDRVRVIIRIPF